MEKAEIVKRVSVKDTLMAIPIGEGRIIMAKDIKPVSVRTAARALRANGYEYKCTDQGVYDRIVVVRLK